jgi:hypothetical protein
VEECQEAAQGKTEQEADVDSENSLRRRNRRRILQERIREAPTIVRSWKSCEGFNPRRRKEGTQSHRDSAIGVHGGKSFILVEIANSDFPI